MTAALTERGAHEEHPPIEAPDRAQPVVEIGFDPARNGVASFDGRLRQRHARERAPPRDAAAVATTIHAGSRKNAIDPPARIAFSRRRRFRLSKIPLAVRLQV